MAKTQSPDPVVSELLDSFAHPLRAEIDALRALILEADPAIREGVKWNSSSFATTEWFATVNWRKKDAVQLVMHLGAKAKGKSVENMINDPDGFLTWLAKDRALLTLPAGAMTAKTKKAVTALIKSWIGFVE